MSRQIVLLAMTLSAALLGSGRASAASEEPDTGTTHAVLVGVTEYPRLRELLGAERYASEIRLDGPEHDVALFAEILGQLLNADAAHVTRLSGYGADEATRPTRANILDALARLATDVREGDLAVVFLAGHGSQQPDTSGDEADRKDEIFLPADAGEWRRVEGSVENAITDDELGAAVDAIAARGARVWLIVDSCHSGTMLRGDLGRVALRQIDSKLLGVPEVVTRGDGTEGEGSMADVTSGEVVAMYGASSRESAPEMPLPSDQTDAPVRGLFSFQLARQLSAVGPGATYGQLFERVVAAYRALPYFAATPSVEGDLSRRILDGAPQGLRLQVWEENGDVVLNAGRLHGIEPDTVLGVHLAGSGADLGEKIGRVRVYSSDLDRSICVWMDGGAPPLTGDARVCGARIESAPIATAALRLVVMRGGEPVNGDAMPRAVRDVLGALAVQVRPVDHPADAEWTLSLDGSAWRLARRDSPKRSFEVSENSLEDALRRIFRAQSLSALALHSQAGGLPEGLEVRLLAEDGARLRSGSTIRPGSRARLEIENRGYERWDVWAFTLDPNYGMLKVFPPRQTTALVEPSSSRDSENLIFDDSTLGLESILVFAVPPGSGELASLQQERLTEAFGARVRGQGATDGVREFLQELALGTERMTRSGRAEAVSSIAANLISYDVAWETPDRPARLGPDAVPLVRPRDFVGRDGTEDAAPSLRESGVRLRGDQAELYARVAPAIFAVRTRVGHGTGFVIDAKEGLVVTNNHVIDGGVGYSKLGRRTVSLVRGSIDADGVMRLAEDDVPATIVMSDPDRDLALLRIVGSPKWLESVSALTVREAPARVGEETVIIGHPSSGMLWTLRTGNVSSVGRSPHDMIDFVVGRLGLAAADRASLDQRLARETPVKILLSSSGANPGDSGGPLLDKDGQVLGVTYAIPSEVRDDKFTYHVHRDELRAFLAGQPSPEEEARPDVPDAWRTGPNIMLDTARDTNDLLIGGSEKSSVVMIDVDGNSRDLSRAPEALRKLVDDRGFDAEMAIRFGIGEVATFYDRDADGVFDLVLVDLDGDPIADVRFERVDDEWIVDTEVDEPLIHVAVLGLGQHLENEALKKVRAVLTR